MATSVNKVIIMGYVGKDPEIKSIANGNMVANISIATQRYRKNINGEKDEQTDWHRCVLWNRQAEIAQQYVKKGSLLYVEGRIEYRDWTDKEGNRRTSTDIVVEQMQLLPTSKDPRAIDFGQIDESKQDLRSGTGFEDYGKKKKDPEKPVEPDSAKGEDPWGDDEDDDEKDSIPF